MKATHTIRSFLRLMRIKQWSKNTLVFAALLFSLKQVDITDMRRTVLGFLLFSLTASCIYILNDFADREKDKLHPEKKHRPLASGILPAVPTLIFSFVMLSVTMTASWFLSPSFFFVLTTYYALNIGYSFWWKNIVILDVMLIASGFVLRALAGAVVIDVPLTPWFLLCTLFLALFLAISKRRHELTNLPDDRSKHRAVLAHYSTELLDQMNSLVITSCIIFYSLFTFWSSQSNWMMLTIPFVLFGIFRYLYLIHVKNKGGSPDKLLTEDKPILLTVLLYTLCVIFITLYT